MGGERDVNVKTYEINRKRLGKDSLSILKGRPREPVVTVHATEIHSSLRKEHNLQSTRL